MAADSRLPAWFAVPTGVSRTDLTATMLYYTSPSGRSVTFQLWDARGHKLDELSAPLAGLEPRTFGPKSAAGGFDTRSYPLYEIVTINGVTEVIEHRLFSRVFYVTDDPEIKRKLGL